MADPIVNFFKSTLVGTYSNTDTSFTIATGDGALLPDPSTDGEYNLTIFRGLQVNANTTFEIVRVTAKSGDVLTVTRQQEGTTALTVDSEVHSILMSATKKTFDDIRTDIDNIPLPNQTLNTTSDVAFNSVDVENTFLLPIKTSLPSSGTLGEMFYYSPKETMVFFDGSHFREINASYLIGMGLATAQVTANGITLAVDNDFARATATASANNATTTFLSGVTRSLELATTTASGLDAVASFLGFDVEYLVIAGGAGGGRNTGGGGGAGGYRTSSFFYTTGDSVTVTVGAGGSGSSNNSVNGSNGSNSVFSTITSAGGGGGASRDTTGSSGGSGGGGSGHDQDGPTTKTAGSGNTPSVTPSQGNNGGIGDPRGNGKYLAGGGGGAGQAGASGQTSDGSGGDGSQSSITGSAIYRAGGGGGGTEYSSYYNTFGLETQVPGGQGGGGLGGNTSFGQGATSGTANTGGGGGGGAYNDNGASGGSGIVIISYPSDKTISGGSGLTFSTSTVGANKVTQFTAGTGSISIG